MDFEATIRGSLWWRDAARTPDRHHPSDSGVMVSDHLLAVRRVVWALLTRDPVHPYVVELRDSLVGYGLSLERLGRLLATVALLHDIGKPRENKDAQGPHPTRGKAVAWRHPVVGMQAAVELIPDGFEEKTLILHLVERHGIGWAWYCNATKGGQVPSAKAWARLDRAICDRPGHGLLCLALFKLADIEGHGQLADVPWFVRHANEGLLDSLRLTLPVPREPAMAALRRVAQSPGVNHSGFQMQ